LSRYSQNAASSFEGGPPVKATVKWFNAAKGFGFVAPSDGSPDAFLHISVLNRSGHDALADGTEIMCSIGQGPKGPQVSRITEVLGGGVPAAPRPPREPRGFGGGGGYDRGGGFDRGGYDRGGFGGGGRSAPSGPEVELSGTVKWFKPDKGFGFVTADDESKDVFVHKSTLRRCGLMMLESGQRVQMRVQEADKGREATWIMPL
jgi:CspA family cold shock protein